MKPRIFALAMALSIASPTLVASTLRIDGEDLLPDLEAMDEELFAQHGFAGTSLRQVTSRADGCHSVGPFELAK